MRDRCFIVIKRAHNAIKVLIPHFTGNMIDNVVESGDQASFRKSTLYLVLASISCAVFTGIR